MSSTAQELTSAAKSRGLGSLRVLLLELASEGCLQM